MINLENLECKFFLPNEYKFNLSLLKQKIYLCCYCVFSGTLPDLQYIKHNNLKEVICRKQKTIKEIVITLKYHGYKSISLGF